MSFQIDILKDKIEFYEASTLKELERNIQIQIEHNQAILLRVHSVSHQIVINDKGRPFYSAVVHYRAHS